MGIILNEMFYEVCGILIVIGFALYRDFKIRLSISNKDLSKPFLFRYQDSILIQTIGMFAFFAAVGGTFGLMVSSTNSYARLAFALGFLGLLLRYFSSRVYVVDHDAIRCSLGGMRLGSIPLASVKSMAYNKKHLLIEVGAGTDLSGFPKKTVEHIFNKHKTEFQIRFCSDNSSSNAVVIIEKIKERLNRKATVYELKAPDDLFWIA